MVQKSGKCDGDAAKPHSTVAIFHFGATPRGTRAASDGVAPHIMLRAALKPKDNIRVPHHVEVAPHTMLRAALKRKSLYREGHKLSRCTTFMPYTVFSNEIHYLLRHQGRSRPCPCCEVARSTGTSRAVQRVYLLGIGGTDGGDAHRTSPPSAHGECAAAPHRSTLPCLRAGCVDAR